MPIVVALVTTCVAALAAAGCTRVSPPLTSTGGDSSQTTAASSGSKAAGPTGHRAGSLNSGGLDRSYHLYVPAKAAEVGSVPLLVALHGGGGSGAHFEQISGFDKLADSAGFIVAYPDAAQPPGGRVPTWNAGAC